MNTVPIAYLDVVHLEFANGRVWEINIKEQTISLDQDTIATRLVETLREYKDEIVKIEFKVDIVRLKTDINKSTKTIF